MGTEVEESHPDRTQRISSFGRASDWKARCNTESGLSPRCRKGFFSQSQRTVQTLIRCPYSPCVQLHASTPVCTLKSQTLVAIPLFGHMKIQHTLIGMGSSVLLVAVPYLGKVTEVSHKGQWSTKIIYVYNHYGWLGIKKQLSTQVSHKGQWSTKITYVYNRRGWLGNEKQLSILSIYQKDPQSLEKKTVLFSPCCVFMQKQRGWIEAGYTLWNMTSLIYTCMCWLLWACAERERIQNTEILFNKAIAPLKGCKHNKPCNAMHTQ